MLCNYVSIKRSKMQHNLFVVTLSSLDFQFQVRLEPTNVSGIPFSRSHSWVGSLSNQQILDWAEKAFRYKHFSLFFLSISDKVKLFNVTDTRCQ
jgi:hypothetical protein